MIGKTISHYRILERLGAGGMGVLYRAEDIRLGRPVALKFLPEDLARDPTALERLQREARAASALNHPNICTIHDIDAHEGQPFLVMEFLEGQALNHRIAGQPLRLQQILELGIQIADALDAAHLKGILHRDIKPANIFVTSRGQAKLLDFGLAKVARRRVAEAVGVSTLPTAGTAEEHLTSSGVAVGTVAYMSPEQARGEELDARTDLFSFGAVLFEMATGRQAFSGTTTAVVFDAILHGIPPSVVRLNPDLPPELEHIINKALEKDRDLRYQSAAELRADLKRLQRESTSVRTAAVPAAAPVRKAPFLPWPWIAAGSIVVVLAAVVGTLVWKKSQEPVTGLAPGGRLTLLVSTPYRIFDPSLSPDGKMIVYVAEEGGQVDLFVGRVAGGEKIRLTNDEARETDPTFSPDGDRIAFTRLRSDTAVPEVCLVPTLGGSIVPVLEGATYPAWSPDGQRLAFVRRRSNEPEALATAAADGSDERVLFRADASYAFFRNPVWSPDGSKLAVVRSAGGASGELWLVPLRGGDPRRLTSDPPGVVSDEPAFTPDGRGVVHSSTRGGATNLWVQPLDGSAPVRLTTGAGPDESPGVAADGKIIFINPRWRYVLLEHELATGESRELVTHSSFIWGPAISPDGREVAYSQAEADGSWHIWIVSRAGGVPRRLTSGDVPQIFPRFTPDGSWITYNTWSRGGLNRIWKVSRAGGPAVPLSPPDTDDSYGSVSPDGRWLLFTRSAQGTARIHIAPVEGGEARALTESPSEVPQWSPDGRWVAFSPSRDLRSGIYVIGTDGRGLRRLTEIGSWPVWWPDGQRISYLVVRPDGTQEIRAVPFRGGASQVVSSPRYPGTNHPFDLARDGKRLVSSNAVHLASEIWLYEPPR